LETVHGFWDSVFSVTKVGFLFMKSPAKSYFFEKFSIRTLKWKLHKNSKTLSLQKQLKMYFDLILTACGLKDPLYFKQK
jgi:hypothetical protein